MNWTIIKPFLLILLIRKKETQRGRWFVQIMQRSRVEPGPKSSFLASFKGAEKVHEKIGGLKNADDMFLQATPRACQELPKRPDNLEGKKTVFFNLKIKESWEMEAPVPHKTQVFFVFVCFFYMHTIP